MDKENNLVISGIGPFNCWTWYICGFRDYQIMSQLHVAPPMLYSQVSLLATHQHL